MKIEVLHININDLVINANESTVTLNIGNTDAQPTNRVFTGWWGDAEQGEEYTSEWSDTVIGSDGERYEVIWQFTEIKGDESDDASNYPWDDINCITVNPL